MKFDDITILLGQFGKYQKILYFLVCLPGIYTGMQMLSSVFTLAIPDHRCQIPGLSNDTFEVQSPPHAVLINQSVPWELDDDDEYVYVTCDLYVTNNVTTYNADNIPANSSRRECDEWVYDKSTFESTVITEFDLICGQELARANANMVLMAGVLFGAILMGIFSDIFGRKTALMVSIFLHIGAAFGSTFAPSFPVFVAFRFLQGFSNMGIFMSAFVIGVELVGPDYRVVAGIVIEFFWCIGLYVLNLLAYFIRDWNTLQLSLACPAVLLIAYFWLVPESPRWLISRGKYDKAEVIIQKCAKMNGVKLPDNVVGKDSSEENTEKQSVLKMLTVPKLLIRTLIIYFNWCVVSMVYYGLGLNVGNLDGDIYVNFAINSTMEVAAYVMCLLLLNKLGRKVLHAGTMILGGVACLCTIFTVLYASKDLYWITVVLSNIGKFGISAAFAIIYVWTAELFPTNVRNSGMGSSSMCARVGGILCPYVADLTTLPYLSLIVTPYNTFANREDPDQPAPTGAGKVVEGSFGTALPLIIFGGLSVLAGLLSLILPETAGRVLPETIDDAVKFGDSNDGPKKSKSNKYYINNAYDKSETGEYKGQI